MPGPAWVGQVMCNKSLAHASRGLRQHSLFKHTRLWGCMSVYETVGI